MRSPLHLDLVINSSGILHPSGRGETRLQGSIKKKKIKIKKKTCMAQSLQTRTLKHEISRNLNRHKYWVINCGAFKWEAEIKVILLAVPLRRGKGCKVPANFFT